MISVKNCINKIESQNNRKQLLKQFIAQSYSCTTDSETQKEWIKSKLDILNDKQIVHVMDFLNKNITFDCICLIFDQ